MKETNWREHPLLGVIPQFYGTDALKQRKWIHRHHPKNQILHLEGDPCDGLELIVDGEIHVERINEDGTTMIMSVFHTGDLLGGNLLFSKNPVFPMLVEAKTDSQVIYMPRDEVFLLCQTNGAFLLSFLQSISQNANFLGDKIRSNLQIPLKQRILRYLEKESLRQNSSTIEMEGSKKLLAGQMGVARTSFSRALQQLKVEGLVEYDRRTITLVGVLSR